MVSKHYTRTFHCFLFDLTFLVLWINFRKSRVSMGGLLYNEFRAVGHSERTVF